MGSDAERIPVLGGAERRIKRSFPARILSETHSDLFHKCLSEASPGLSLVFPFRLLLLTYLWESEGEDIIQGPGGPKVVKERHIGQPKNPFIRDEEDNGFFGCPYLSFTFHLWGLQAGLWSTNHDSLRSTLDSLPLDAHLERQRAVNPKS